MSILRYKRGDTRTFVDDDFADVIDWYSRWPTTGTWTWRGQWIDTDKYDIVPKKEYKKTLIENKQKEITKLDEERKRLEQELEELRKD